MTNLIKNRYIYHDNYVCINIHSRKYGEKEFLIDWSDFEFCKLFNWSIAPRKIKSGILLYAQARIFGTPILLHNALMRTPKGMVVDHINRNTLDNRRENLRIVTHSENAKNRAGYGACKYKYMSVNKARVHHNQSYTIKLPSFKTKTFTNINEAKAYYVECLLNGDE